MKSTILTTLVVALLAGTAGTAHPYPREQPPDNPTATLTYANNATVQLSARGNWHEAGKQCQGLLGDQGIVHAEVLTRYITWNQRQAYHLMLYPEWGCLEKDPATGKYREAARLQTYAGNGEVMRDRDGQAFVPKSFGFAPAFRD